MRLLERIVGWIGWLLLGASAVAGVAVAAVMAFALSPLGAPIVASRAVALLDAAVQGTFTLEAAGILPGGGVEVRGLAVRAPGGEEVLRVGIARLSLDVRHLRARDLGVALELEGPFVDLARDEDGTLLLAKAFAPSRPSPEEDEEGGPFRWTIRLTALALRGGELRSSGMDEVPDLLVRDVSLDARGSWGPRGGGLEARLRGALEEPFVAPVVLDAAATLDGGALRVAALRAEVGENGVELVGEGDLAARAGRVALLRLGVARAELAHFVPRAGELGGKLRGGAYAESDGQVATVALRLAPPEGAEEGTLDATGALSLPPAAFAAGFRLEARALDPRGLLGRAPEGAVTLAASGALAIAEGAGDLLRRLDANVDLRVAPSRIGKAPLGPITLVGRARGGLLDVSRLDARLPGLVLGGAARWREGGAVAGTLDLNATDLRRAVTTVGALAGVELPPLGGRGRFAVRMSGTSRRPAFDADVDAASLRYGDLAFERARLTAGVSGPIARPDLKVEGTVGAFRSGETLVMQDVRVSGSLARLEVLAVDLTASFPDVGTEPLSVAAKGAFGPRHDRLRVDTLALSWPGARYRLAAPATLRFAGPAVDRVELVSGESRIAVSGGLGPRGRVDARAEVESLDVGRLPPGVLPADLGLGGVVSLDATVRGTTSRPVVDGRFRVEDGRWRDVAGVDALGTARWDGAARRASVDVEARRGGAAVAVKADVPAALSRARPGEPISAAVRADGVDLEELAGLLGLELPVAGRAGLEATLGGTAGAPALEARLAVADGAWERLAPLALELRVEAPGEEARLALRAEHGGAGTILAEGTLPLDLAELLARPGPAVERLRRAPLALRAEVPGLELAPLSGRAGIPAGLAGRLVARADLAGTLDAPRGTVSVGLSNGAVANYTGLGATVQAALRNDAVTLEALAALGEDALVQLDARLGAPVEGLLGAERLRRAPLRIEARVPGVALDRAARGPVPIAGNVEGRLGVTGTLGVPVAELTAIGRGITVNGRPLGNVTARARYAAGRTTAEADLRPRAGGVLRATFALAAPLGVGVDLAGLDAAPAEATLRAERVDLAVLPALLPGTIASADGTLEADLRAKGPLASLRPRGTLRVSDGRVAVVEYGEWTAVTVDATLGDDEIRVTRLAARRGPGKLEASASMKGLLSPAATLEAQARLEALTVVYGGQDAATIDLRADATGVLRGRALEAKVSVDSAVIRLPRGSRRELQELSDRPDIVIGRQEEEEEDEGGAEERPFSAVVQVAMPARVQVLSESPRIDLTLRGDTRFELEGGDLFAEGSIEVVRGEVEPLGGRLFEVERGRVQFTGGPPRAAVLDVEAEYVHPQATVTVLVTGPALEPTIKLSSQPPMDDAQIATLIATGRTDLKAGTGGADASMTGEEAGRAILGATMTKVFGDLVADKLPFDTVAIDTGGVRAGTYLNDRVYVGYTRRFDAQPGERENVDELRVEYQITPRWTLEGQVGDERSSGSLIWSRDY